MNAKRNLKRERGGRRVVVKVGTALITGGGGRLNLETMASLVSQIARLRADGWLMSLVSSGAVAAGRGALPESAGYRNIPMRQALAAIGQGRLMNVYEQLFGWYDVQVAQALLANRDINDREGYLNIRNTLTGLMDYGIVPIINENDVVSVDELGGRSFGDNDMLSAMVANIVDADMLIMLGHVEGLFTGDPHSDPKARLVPEVAAFTDEIDALAGPSADGRGRGGMVTKLQAARLATSSGVRVVIAGGQNAERHSETAGRRIAWDALPDQRHAHREPQALSAKPDARLGSADDRRRRGQGARVPKPQPAAGGRRRRNRRVRARRGRHRDGRARAARRARNIQLRLARRPTHHAPAFGYDRADARTLLRR